MSTSPTLSTSPKQGRSSRTTGKRVHEAVEANGSYMGVLGRSPTTFDAKRTKGSGGGVSTLEPNLPPPKTQSPPVRIGEMDSSDVPLGGALALRANAELEEIPTAATRQLDPGFFSVDDIFKRLLAVFLQGSTGANDSGATTLTEHVNNGLLTRALDAIKEFVQRAATPDSNLWQPPSRAPIEKMLAWVLVDMLGGVLVDAGIAEKIGKRLIKRLNDSAAEVEKIEAKFKAAEKLATSGKDLSSWERTLATAPANIKKEEA